MKKQLQVLIEKYAMQMLEFEAKIKSENEYCMKIQKECGGVVEIYTDNDSWIDTDSKRRQLRAAKNQLNLVYLDLCDIVYPTKI